MNDMLKKLKITILYVLTLCVLASCMKKRSYEGFKVLRVNPLDEEELSKVKSLESLADVDFWKLPAVNRSTDFMVAPDKLMTVHNYLQQHQIKFEDVADVQDLINMEEESLHPRAKRKDSKTGRAYPLSGFFNQVNNCEDTPAPKKRMNWYEYHNWNTIEYFLDELARRYSHVPVKMKTIGYSNQQRPLKLLEVGSGDIEVFIEGGAHAREWISPAAVTYFLNHLLENRRSHPELLSKITWYILPVANPDGYEYSKRCDPMWRKNRSGDRRNRCVGVDLNRNYNFHWMEVGASDNPCRPNYAGPHPLSEKETQAISKFILSKKRRSNTNDILMYISFHSYGQYWLTPWGYTHEEPNDVSELIRLGREAVSAIRRTDGVYYELGTIPKVLQYLAGGASDDWAKGKAGIKYSYTVELPDTGQHGFLLPAKNITPTGKEVVASLKAAANYLIRKYGKDSGLQQGASSHNTNYNYNDYNPSGSNYPSDHYNSNSPSGDSNNGYYNFNYQGSNPNNGYYNSNSPSGSSNNGYYNSNSPSGGSNNGYYNSNSPSGVSNNGYYPFFNSDKYNGYNYGNGYRPSNNNNNNGYYNHGNYGNNGYNTYNSGGYGSYYGSGSTSMRFPYRGTIQFHPREG